MPSVQPDGGIAVWSSRWAKRPSSTSSDPEPEGTCIPLTDLRSTLPPDSVANGTPLVPAHPTGVGMPRAPHTASEGAGSTTSSSADRNLEEDRRRASLVMSPPSSSSSSSSPSSFSSSPSAPPWPKPRQDNGTHDQTAATTAGVDTERRRLHSQTSPSQGPQQTTQPRLQQLDRGAPAIKPGEYMRGIAAEARAWSVRALAGGAPRDDVDPVKMLLPDAAMGQRVGGPAGRGPLLRRLQTVVYGMLDDFVVVTITRPGPLYVRLRPDPRGLVVVNNFDLVPDDPHTSCPRLGPVESVGTVMPGDALASVNRDVLFGRPFSECVRYIREASSGATVTAPCVLCFRRADPALLEAKIAAPPRSLEQEKMRSLERLLEGGEGGSLDEAKLRGITSMGVPDSGGLRPVLWRLLLRCLPANRLEWPEHLQTQREQYARFVQDLIHKPAKIVTHGGASSRGEEPPLDGAAKAANGDIADSAYRRTQATTHREVSCANGDLRASKTTAHVTGPPEEVPPVGNGTNDLVRPCHSPSERNNREKYDTSTLGAQDTAPPTSGAKAVPSRPHPGLSDPSQGEPRVDRELRPTDDDPLSNKDTSEWAALWSDKDLMQAIEQDVVRTMPDLAFYACRSIEDDADDLVNDSGGGDARGEQRRQGRERRLAIARILFVHAKLNPAESYTQGMNEIVATLYFVLASDGEEEWSQHCEADTFFCFTNLMSEIRDVFIQSLDESESGLQGKMEAFSRTLRQHDPQLAAHMVSLALDPRYFALRWFTTLLSREFDLPDTIRLWDSLFASEDRSTFLVFVFVTLLLTQRETLLAGDFPSNLQLLQAYPPTDVPGILARSEALRLFSARGDAAKAGGLRELRAREAADGAMQAAEQVNAAARRFWNAAADMAAGAAERMTTMNDDDGDAGYQEVAGGRSDIEGLPNGSSSS